MTGSDDRLQNRTTPQGSGSLEQEDSPPTEQPLVVTLMLCHKHVDMAARLIPPFQANLRDKHKLWVFDDGTFTEADLERIHVAIKPDRVISLEEANDLVIPALAKYPSCQRLREGHVVMRKLLDMPMVANSTMAMVDSDVTAISPFTGLDRRGVGDEPIAMMIDYGEAYSMTYWHRHFGPGRVQLVDRANAGFVYLTPEVYDLDFIEHFVSDDRNLSRSRWMMEQTAWAAITARAGGCFFDPDQVSMPPRDPGQPRSSVVLHFISRLRHAMDEPGYLDQLFESGRQQAPRQLATIPAPSSGFTAGLIKKVLARGNRRHFVKSA
ncbi:MAG: hypothetical protein AAGC44_15440 [Planctomycetota bacterium]